MSRKLLPRSLKSAGSAGGIELAGEMVVLWPTWPSPQTSAGDNKLLDLEMFQQITAVCVARVGHGAFRRDLCTFSRQVRVSRAHRLTQTEYSYAPTVDQGVFLVKLQQLQSTDRASV